MKRFLERFTFVWGLAILLLALGNDMVLAAATKEAEFYKGKTLTFIVPYKTGAGYDSLVRLIAPFLGKHTGTTVVVKNVDGAGGLLATNQLFATEPNGLTIGILNGPGLIQSQITNFSGVKYDLLKFVWIGRITAETRVLVRGNKSSFKTIQMMRKSTVPVKLGAGGMADSSYIECVIASEGLGINSDLIYGYGSSKEVDLSVIRGDIDATTGSFSSKVDYVNNGDMAFIARFGPSKYTELANVPNIADQPGMNDEQKKLIRLMVSIGQAGRSVAAPPGLAPEKAKFLEECMKKSIEEPEFMKMATRQQIDIDYLPPPEHLKIFESAVKLPPNTKKRLAEVLTKYRDK